MRVAEWEGGGAPEAAEQAGDDQVLVGFGERA
jgi:hypothetical protein